MKSFSHQLTELNEGSIHAALTADFAELLRTVQATGRAGSITLKVNWGFLAQITRCSE